MKKYTKTYNPNLNEILDNIEATRNTLSRQEHAGCFSAFKKLRNTDLNSEEAKIILELINRKFINKLISNKPIPWFFYKWSKNCFLSDDFLSLLSALENDYQFLRTEEEPEKGYISLYNS